MAVDGFHKAPGPAISAEEFQPGEIAGSTLKP
jgi:hypothetical protein